MQMERLALKPAEAAVALGISRAKAYELIRRGELPSILIGARIRVPVDSLRQWINGAQPLVDPHAGELCR